MRKLVNNLAKVFKQHANDKGLVKMTFPMMMRLTGSKSRSSIGKAKGKLIKSGAISNTPKQSFYKVNLTNSKVNHSKDDASNQLHKLINKYGIKECIKDIVITQHRLAGISKTNKRIGGVPASQSKINLVRQIYNAHYNGDRLTPLLHDNHLTYAQYYYLSNKYIK